MKHYLSYYRISMGRNNDCDLLKLTPDQIISTVQQKFAIEMMGFYSVHKMYTVVIFILYYIILSLYNIIYSIYIVYIYIF